MITQQTARMEDYLKRIALLCDGRNAVKVTEPATIWQHARWKIREKINAMASHNSNQTKMNHLAKITDLSAPLYDLIFRLFWFTRGREAEFRQKVTGVIQARQRVNGNDVKPTWDW